MKKLYFLTIASALGLTLNAQTLTQTNNGFVAGDMYSTLQCDSLNITPGATGSGATWNYSAITIHNSVVSNYTAVTSTNPSYPPGSISLAAGVNQQAYYVFTATDARYYGGAISVQASSGSILANLTYSAPATSKVYPMSLNSTSTSAIGGTINLTSPVSLTGSFTGSSKTIADGSGTLNLPGGAAGTYTDVLRVVTSQTLNYTTSLLSGVITLIGYDYYSPSKKASLFTISTITVTSGFSAPSTQTIVTVNKDYQQIITGLNKNTTVAADVLVYPNPSNSMVNFSTEGKAAVKEVKVFDVTGKLIEAQPMTEGNAKLDVSNYNKGIYIYQILNAGGETVKTGKLTVN